MIRAPVISTPKDTVSLIAAGDVMFGRQVQRQLQPFGYKRPFRWVAPLIRGHDIALCNLETPITRKRLRWMRGPLVFRARPVAAQILRRAGFNLMVTANNHARDQGLKGLRETLTHLKGANLPWVGTGRTQRRAWKPYLLKKNGISVGIIAATTIRNYKFRPLGAHFAYIPRHQLHRLAWVVKTLKRKVDIVIVSLHFGAEYKTQTTYRERKWVRTILRAGCDLFLGHHPHVLRGIQRLGRRVAFYSLGNFMFDLGWPATRESALARVIFEKRNGRAQIKSAELIPVLINSQDNTPRRVKGQQAKAILSKVVSYSRKWKGQRYLKIVGNRLRVDFSKP